MRTEMDSEIDRFVVRLTGTEPLSTSCIDAVAVFRARIQHRKVAMGLPFSFTVLPPAPERLAMAQWSADDGDEAEESGRR